MVRFFLCIWFSVCFKGLLAQVYVVVDSFPENTDMLYLSGEANGWNPADREMLLKEEKGRYSLFCSTCKAGTAYKFTAGSWDLVETAADGSLRDNRFFPEILPDTVFVQVVAWKTHQEIAPPENIVVHSLIGPDGKTQRNLRIYLPPDYVNNEQRYPVLYLFDGQNLFDNATSYSGEWGVDEAMTERHKAGLPTAVVVGIDHGGVQRINELSPWPNAMYGGGGGLDFSRWILDSVFTYMYENYRIDTLRSGTWVGGSSLGGLMAYWMAIEYPEQIGAAAVFSPAFWFNPEIVQHTQDQQEWLPLKVYFLAGGQESKTMESDIWTVYQALKVKGDVSANIRFVLEASGKHEEPFWRRELPQLFNYLLPAKP